FGPRDLGRRCRMYAGLQLRLWRNGNCSRRLKHRPGDPMLLCPIGGQPFYGRRAFAGHENNGFVTHAKGSEICADDSIAGASFSPSGRVIDSVKTYLGSITNGSWHSGEPNECARAGTRAITRDEGGHTSFAYPIADLQGGVCAAAIAHERDNHLLVGMASPDGIDLIRLLFEGFEVLDIDLADHINKHSAVGVRCMNRDRR